MQGLRGFSPDPYIGPRGVPMEEHAGGSQSVLGLQPDAHRRDRGRVRRPADRDGRSARSGAGRGCRDRRIPDVGSCRRDRDRGRRRNEPHGDRRSTGPTSSPSSASAWSPPTTRVAPVIRSRRSPRSPSSSRSAQTGDDDAAARPGQGVRVADHHHRRRSDRVDRRPARRRRQWSIAARSPCWRRRCCRKARRAASSPSPMEFDRRRSRRTRPPACTSSPGRRMPCTCPMASASSTCSSSPSPSCCSCSPERRWSPSSAACSSGRASIR